MSRFDNNCLWITCSLDHRFTVAVFVSEVCRHGKMSYPRVSDPENVDAADIPPDFNFVQLFHNSVDVG